MRFIIDINSRNIILNKNKYEKNLVYDILYKTFLVWILLHIRFDEVDGDLLKFIMKLGIWCCLVVIFVIEFMIIFEYYEFMIIIYRIKYLISKKVLLQIVLIIILQESETIQ